MAHFTDRLIGKLENFSSVSGRHREILRGLTGTERRIAPGETILHEGDRPHSSIVLVSGVLFRFKIISDSQRQIISLHFSGDIPDLQALFLEVMDHNLCAAGPAVIAAVPHKQLEALFVEHPQLGMLLWRDTLIDAAIFREWIANTGRRQAFARTAHLFCEIAVRMRAAGMGEREMVLPLTQQHFADALGLSIVHVNRVMQDLRAQNLVRIGNGRFEILDWKGLCDAGDFDPGYLHLRERFSF